MGRPVSRHSGPASADVKKELPGLGLATTMPVDSESGEIRIMRLLPGKFDDRLECELSRGLLNTVAAIIKLPAGQLAAPLTTGQVYEALSYTWGSWENFEVIYYEIAGDSTANRWGYISITRNLYVALRRLRRETCSRTLWVDAICIDQSSLSERGLQVRNMSRIYNQASKVLVWLGDADNTWAAMLCTNPRWDSRAWVLQEYILASSTPVLCFGIHEIASNAGARSSLTVPNRIGVLEKLRGTGETKLFEILPLLLNCEATVLNDYIYSIRGLLTESEARHISIDYHVDPEDTFIRATIASILGGYDTDLRILVYCQLDKNMGTLPSWAVNFSQIAHENFSSWRRLLEISNSTTLYTPTDPRLLQPSVQDTVGGLLYLQVWFFDSVVAVVAQTAGYVQPSRSDDDFNRAVVDRDERGRDAYRVLERAADIASTSGRWFGHSPLNGTVQPTSQNRLTSRGGLDFEQTEPVRDDMIAPELALWSRNAGHDYKPFEKDSHLWRTALRQEDQTRWPLFITSSGFYGISKGNVAKVGDVVVLPLTGPFPMLLRPVGSRYTFMGFCYVHGIMNGELMLRIPDLRLPMYRVTLR